MVSTETYLNLIDERLSTLEHEKNQADAVGDDDSIEAIEFEMNQWEAIRHRVQAFDALMEALKTSPCPASTKEPPDNTVEACIARGECGCDNRIALKQAEAGDE